MRIEMDGNTPSEQSSSVETPSSSPVEAPAEPASPTTNAFEAGFLVRMNEHDEPATASEADLAGPWRIAPVPDGTFGLFRTWQSPEEGAEPRGRFVTHELALQTLALLPLLGRSPAYRLREKPDDQGYALESREEWGAVVGHLPNHHPELATGLSLLDALARSPQALALLLESCGKVALEHAGAILANRVREEE
jgi:hypothetical protein